MYHNKLGVSTFHLFCHIYQQTLNKNQNINETIKSKTNNKRYKDIITMSLSSIVNLCIDITIIPKYIQINKPIPTKKKVHI